MIKLKHSPPPEFLKAETRDGYYVSEKIKEVWAVELDLAQELLRVCEKHNLKIYAEFGTLLGAVRHKGFIPWDDDIDFSMLRSDYEKLCQIAPTEFSHPYFFQFSNTGKDFLNGHAKLRNSETTGIVKDELKRNLQYNQGIFIDIFPLDNVSDNGLICFFQMRLAHYSNLLMLFFAYFSSRYFESDSFFRIPKKIIHLIVNKPFRLLQVVSYKTMMFFSLMFFSKETQNIAGLSFRIGVIKQSRADFEDIIKAKYEFLKMPIVEKYDRVLTRWFGNWKVPQIQKNDHGDVIFDTGKSYLEYFKRSLTSHQEHFF